MTSSISSSSSSSRQHVLISPKQLMMILIALSLLLLVAFFGWSDMNTNNNNTMMAVPKSRRQSSSKSILSCHDVCSINKNTNSQNHQKRYEPSPWKRGRRFPRDTTPLSMIMNSNNNNNNNYNNQEQQQRTKNFQNSLPLSDDDWDGGYGWVFVQYHSSPFEVRWRRESRNVEKIMTGTPLCDLRTEKFEREEQLYEKELYRMPSDDGGHTNEKCISRGFPDEPMKFDDEIFSKFEYEFKCTRPPCKSPPPLSPRIGQTKFTYIEPLVGLLRHPHVCRQGSTVLSSSNDNKDTRNINNIDNMKNQEKNSESWIRNKNYMIIDSWSLLNPSRSTISPPDPKIMYFDLGASTWNDGKGGASQSWFKKVYEEGNCLNFTDWFVYEAKEHDPQKVYDSLPGDIKPGYRWQNIFLSSDPKSWDNPLNTLLMEAKKEDVVIFKIDFDDPKKEMELVQQILDYPEVSELIDELYFEMHLNIEIMRTIWGTMGNKHLEEAVHRLFHSDSLRLFTALRKKGIRAHSWV